MNELRIMSVVGARPNFMKIAPFTRAVDNHNKQTPAGAPRIVHSLVHTGQHYDKAMSSSFFELLHIPRPDVDLEVGSGSHAWQVGQTMIRMEPLLAEWRPDWLVVVGDVNATCAGAITAKKGQIKLAHIEAGLRSFDQAMPEEINRIVTDALADLLLTYDETADANLAAMGVPPQRICRTGNVMIDTLDYCTADAARLDVNAVVNANAVEQTPGATPRKSIVPGSFAVLTLHRPSNVDSRETLAPLVQYLTEEFCKHTTLVWSLHPRTVKQLHSFGIWDSLAKCPNLIPVNPLNYLEMLCLNLNAKLMLTDSGGLQEECCVLGTPCVTLRENTERPVTLLANGGVSVLSGNQPARIREAVRQFHGFGRRPHRPPQWDGHAAERIVQAIIAHHPTA